MSRKRTNLTIRTARLVGGVAVLVFAAGCGLFGGGDDGGDKGAASPGPGARTGATAKPKPAGPFTAARLAAAASVPIRPLGPFGEPKRGRYDRLQAADAAVDPRDLPGVTISPAKCKNAIWAGPSKRTFGKSPAAFQLYVGPDPKDAGGGGTRVSAINVLIDSAGMDPKTALGRRLPGCDTVKLRSKGRTTTLTAQPPLRLGTASRATLHTDGRYSKTWIVTYAGNGYIGNVVVNSVAQPIDVDAIVTQAYRQARRALG